jgi:hypothetical protein
MITDPYRPPVWAMPSNDTPLVIESDKKFPTMCKKLSYMAHQKRRMSMREAGPHENTIYNAPKLTDSRWKGGLVTF